ncbi:MAG: hypothetical protein E7513_04040 [Ruminococcaceae bacterium]|nr:hypothetical protein [Oscillospiraceae bacterium]
MKNFCGKCGSKLDENTGLCPKCSGANGLKKKTFIIVAVIFAVILIGGLIIAFETHLFNKDDNKTVTENIVETQAEETQAQTESPTQAPTQEPTKAVKAEKFRDGKTYSSDVLQDYNGQVYYCSADSTEGVMGFNVFDYSVLGLGYKKLPIDVDGGVHAFLIYEDSVYYICDYNREVDPNYGVYDCGKLYRCDLLGNNRELIADDVTNLCFQMIKGELHYNTDNHTSGSYLGYHKTYNIDTKKINILSENESVGMFELGGVYRFESPQYMEFDGGYYYRDYYVESEPDEINGEPVNEYFMRKDMETGEVVRVGYSFSQVR